MTARDVQKKLRKLADPAMAAHSARFFKTGPGQYGEGDVFIGIRVPVLRGVAREHRALPPGEIKKLLDSPVHEERLTALLILVYAFEQADRPGRKSLHDFYLTHTHRVNNWDLVDCTAPGIVGVHLQDRPRGLLDRLARSKSLWERRIAIVATHHFIRQNDFADTLRITRRLLEDEHDLIHKAAGWMLREVGKRDEAALEAFLAQHHKTMPRTMLRYAIERFATRKRLRYLRGK